jgi:NAD(P)H-nitrite reductase large subunit
VDLDQEICICFHVSLRKVINFLRVERPDRVSQLSDCFGAGTGCGWCRRYLAELFDATAKREAAFELPSIEEYSNLREQHIRDSQGTAAPDEPL